MRDTDYDRGDDAAGAAREEEPMQRVNLEEIEKYDDKKFIRPEVLEGERARTLLLCLRPGQSVPAHRHEGYEILLHGLRGQADLTLDGEPVTVRAGDVVLADGANDFAPANNGEANFSMLIMLVRK
jgi:quercetin dioxygenase-like cupin family protein